MSPPRIVLGLDCYLQDAAAFLLRDGEVVAGVEEERLVRRKHTGEFPAEAIRWCLDEAGIHASQIDAVAFPMQPWRGVAHRARQIIGGLPRTLQMLRTRGSAWGRMLALPRRFEAQFGKPRRWLWVGHHEAHAASALWRSPFETAAVLVVDGAGELASTTAYDGDPRRLRPLWSVPFPHSLGYFYSALTEHLGFRPTSDEGKVMGLSSYGQATAAQQRHFGAMLSSGGRVDPSWFCYQDGGFEYASPRWTEAFGPPRVAESPLTDRDRSLAAAGQARLEEVLFSILRRLHDETGRTRLCLAGGVALNCVANGRIVEHTPFREVWVQPLAHDAGAALGAATWAWVTGGGRRPDQQRSVFWGPSYDGHAIDRDVAAVERSSSCDSAGQRDWAARVVDDPAEEAARQIARGRVVGWFRGRMEAGPRALGGRSILADARDPSMPDRVNLRVKRREAFRPFAPAVLAERSHEYFDGAPSRFMTTAHRVLRPDDVPAVTHVDGTARVQAVFADEDAPFRPVLEALDRLTGVPVVLNTSFNLRGEAIVCTPAEAIADFEASDMDCLVLEDRFLDKEDA